MAKRLVLTVISGFFLSQISTYAASNQLISLDEQRDNLLKQITADLVEGKIYPTEARQLKTSLDHVMELETIAQEDKNVSDSEYAGIKNALDTVQTQAGGSAHPTKVWRGINAKDITLEKKINDALDSRKISKDQASDLMAEAEKIKARENSANYANQWEFNEAISIAQDMLALESKIDQLASAGSTQ